MFECVRVYLLHIPNVARGLRVRKGEKVKKKEIELARRAYKFYRERIWPREKKNNNNQPKKMVSIVELVYL